MKSEAGMAPQTWCKGKQAGLNIATHSNCFMIILIVSKMNLCIRKIICNPSDVNMSGNFLPVFDIPSMPHTELSISLSLPSCWY